MEQQEGGSQITVKRNSHMLIGDSIRLEGPDERRQFDPSGTGRTVRCGSKFLGTLPYQRLELGARHQFVDEPPVKRPLATETLRSGAQHIGMVVADLTFVHQS